MQKVDKRKARWYTQCHPIARLLIERCRDNGIPIVIVATVSDDAMQIDALGNDPQDQKRGRVHDALAHAIQSGFFGTCTLTEEVHRV